MIKSLTTAKGKVLSSLAENGSDQIMMACVVARLRTVHAAEKAAGP